MAVTVCEGCKQEFSYPGKKQKRTYCSRACASATMRNASDPDFGGANARFYCEVRTYKHSAKKRGLSWQLNYEACEELFTQPCYLCGKPGPGGIDRMDNRTGYVPGNVLPCCTICNEMKGALHMVQFLEMVEKIHKHATVKGYFALGQSYVKDWGCGDE